MLSMNLCHGYCLADVINESGYHIDKLFSKNESSLDVIESGYRSYN